MVHVLDASRAVDVVSSLLERQARPTFDAANRAEQAETARAVRRAAREKPLLSYERARANRLTHRLGRARIASPSFLGRRDLDDVPLDELVPFIDWTFFFSAWELKGRFPAILDHPQYGAAARELYDNAQALLDADRRRASC